MNATAFGGFGEKGRTSIEIEAEGYRLLLDCGVNTSDRTTYFPALEPAECARLDAIIISHAHEDHIAAVGWAIACGFRGRLLMTEETRVEASEIWQAYASEAEFRLAQGHPIEVISARSAFDLGPFCVETGRSGHIVGGIWVHLSAEGHSVLYCGDVVPASPVFPMDPLPIAELVMLDASYGNDDIEATARIADIRRFLLQNPACLLPMPLIGRSLEMLGLIEQPVALAPGMRDGLIRQINQNDWLNAALMPVLVERLSFAVDWHPGQALPDCPLFCHDGMGLSGPSKRILERAAREEFPVLLTGHVPTGSPGEALLMAKKAQWLRYPTHPTLRDNRAIALATGARKVLAHSCATDVLYALAPAIPNLITDIRPRQSVEI